MTEVARVDVKTLVHELRRRINAGMYGPGTALPSQAALSREFSASRYTVRAAISHLTRIGVLECEYGKPATVVLEHNAHARSGKIWQPILRRSVIVAILPQQPDQFSSLAILHGINARLRSHDSQYRLIVFNNCERIVELDIEEERDALIAAFADGAPGVILWSMDAMQTRSEIEQLQENGTAVVFIDRFAPGFDADFVGIDNSVAARSAVKYLLSLGHTRIAFVADDEVECTTTTRDRRNGYLDIMREHGLHRPELVCMMPAGPAPERDAVEYLFTLDQPPTAVFVNNDATAYEFIYHAEARGLRIPQDVSVVGFDDIDQFSPRRSLLTTIRQPFEEMGRAAADLVLKRISAPSPDENPWTTLLLPTSLTVRSSCSTPNADNRHEICTHNSLHQEKEGKGEPRR
jgi:DNA-binding LacI/PurR family transcriptional regulator